MKSSIEAKCVNCNSEGVFALFKGSWFCKKCYYKLNGEILKENKMNDNEIKQKDKPDMVNNPPHYNFGRYEVIDVLMDWFPDEPLLWQVGKYISRAKHKGKTLEDLKKAEYYLKKRIEIEEKK